MTLAERTTLPAVVYDVQQVAQYLDHTAWTAIAAAEAEIGRLACTQLAHRSPGTTSEPCERSVGFALRGLEGTLRTADAEVTKVSPGLDVVVLDPPRAGAPSSCAAIASAKPRRVVYVSCDAVTLARDAKALVAAGYRIVAVEVAPLFLHTSHVETIVLFDRSKGVAAAAGAS